MVPYYWSFCTVWNQQINDSTLLPSGSIGDLTFSFSNHVITVNGSNPNTQFSDSVLSSIYVQIIKGHKYYLPGYSINSGTYVQIFSGSAGNQTIGYDTIYTPSWSDSSALIRYRVLGGTVMNNVKVVFQLFDLTQMFGAGNEPTTVEAFKRLFPAEYYAYDPGSLLNVNPTTLRTVGFNQFNPSDKYAHVLGGMKYEVTGTYGSLSFKKDKESSTSSAVTVSATTENQSGNTIDSYQGFTPESDGWVYASAGNDADTNIHLVWSGYKNGSDNYEPYWQSNLDLSWIRSIEYNGQALFPDGLKGIGDVHDEVTSTKAIKRIGSVNLGDLTWGYNGDGYGTYFQTSDLSTFGDGSHTACAYYTPDLTFFSSLTDKTIIAYNYWRRLCFRDTSKNASNLVNGHASWLEGVMFYYELATPIEVTFDEEKSLNYREDDFGTEWLLNESSGSTVPGMCKPSDVSIMYQTNLRDYLRNLPSELDTRFDAKANTQGYYPDLQVGLSDNLYSPDGTTDNDTWLFRTSAGNQDIGTGFATLQKLEGQSIVWSQPIVDGENERSLAISGTSLWQWLVYDFVFSINHRYLIQFDAYQDDDVDNKISVIFGTTPDWGNSYLQPISNTLARYSILSKPSVHNTDKLSLLARSGNGSDMPHATTIHISNVTASDLTQMFGSDANICDILGVANLTDSANQTVAIANFKKLFPADYYPYSEPKLLNFNPESLDTVGFNLYNPETGTAELPGETGTPDFTDGKYCYQITGTYTSIAAEDGSTITPNANGYFNVDKPQTVTVVGGNDTDTCIHLCWSGYRNGDYEAYEQYGMNLSWIRDIEYTPEGETEPVKLFPDGLKGVGSAYDEVTATKAIKRIGSIDLGSVNYTYYSDGAYFVCSSISDRKYSNDLNQLTTIYTTIGDQSASAMANVANMSMSPNNNNVSIKFKNTSYTSNDTFKAAMSGVTLYYELATPIEVTFDQPKTLNYRVNDFGTEKFTAPEGATAPGQYYPKDVQIKYQDNLRDKVRNMEANFVSFTTDQTESATESQKAQARENIGMPALLNEKANVNGAYPQLTAGNLISDSSILRQFYYDKTAGEGNEIGSGHATVNQVRGNTIVWNEIIPNGNFSNGTSGWSSAGYGDMSVEDNVLTYTLLDASNSASRIETYHRIPANHICYMACDYFCSKETTANLLIENGNGVRATIPANTWTRVHGISTSGTNVSTQRRFFAYNNSQGQLSDGDVILYRDVILVDLTQMFGLGKEPTAAQFEAMFPSHYYPQNEGTLISCGPTAVVSTGFNQWDEQWELGTLDNDGNPSTSYNSIRSKEYIPVLPDTRYSTNGSYEIVIFFYDKNYNVLQYVPSTGDASAYGKCADCYKNKPLFTTPSNTAYIRFRTAGESVTSYNSNICINISNPSKNGTYQPYTSDTLDLSWISELTYNDGTSDVQMFPNGLCSAGTVYDEVTPTKAIKRVGSVDLGNMFWNYLDVFGTGRNLFVGNTPLGVKSATGFGDNFSYQINSKGYTGTNATILATTDNTGIALKYDEQNRILLKDGIHDGTSLSQGHASWLEEVMVYYELATPIEIPLTKTLGYAVQPGGTEQLLPENQPGQTPVTTQIIMDVTYPLDAVGTLQNLPNNYTSLQVMDNFASSLAQALTSAVGATTITRNSNGTWTITITPAS